MQGGNRALDKSRILACSLFWPILAYFGASCHVFHLFPGPRAVLVPQDYFHVLDSTARTLMTRVQRITMEIIKAI
jgi:Leu/Phe-tRNA-protein transferase